MEIELPRGIPSAGRRENTKPARGPGEKRATEPSPIVTVNLWLDRPVAESAFVGFPGRRFQWLFDKARLFGDRASHVSLVASGLCLVLVPILKKWMHGVN